jgi:hypothetical protein
VRTGALSSEREDIVGSNTVRTRLLIGVGVATIAAAGAAGAFGGSRAAIQPTLAVAVVGPGSVRSTPAGIACPGKCSATFSPGTSVRLSANARGGSRFLRWGGNCAGTRACRVRVSGLAAVAAQFAGGTTPKPPPAQGALAQPGSYSGRNSQNGNGITFYVPTEGRTILTFVLPLVSLSCTGGGGISDHLDILKIPVRSDGSFSATAAQDGMLRGLDVRFTYSVSGRFEGKDNTGAATASGVHRVDIEYKDGTGRKCTSNQQTWTASRVPQAAATDAVEAGGYAGRNSQNGNGISFSVPAGARSVTNFSLPLVSLSCTGGGGTSTPLKILQMPVNADRSFTGTTSETGLLRGVPVKSTYSVTGYFEGKTAAGTATASGVFREDMEYTDGSGRRCTSNDQYWTATRTG